MLYTFENPISQLDPRWIAIFPQKFDRHATKAKCIRLNHRIKEKVLLGQHRTCLFFVCSYSVELRVVCRICWLVRFIFVASISPNVVGYYTHWHSTINTKQILNQFNNSHNSYRTLYSMHHFRCGWCAVITVRYNVAHVDWIRWISYYRKLRSFVSSMFIDSHACGFRIVHIFCLPNIYCSARLIIVPCSMCTKVHCKGVQIPKNWHSQMIFIGSCLLCD